MEEDRVERCDGNEFKRNIRRLTSFERFMCVRIENLAIDSLLYRAGNTIMLAVAALLVVMLCCPRPFFGGWNNI